MKEHFMDTWRAFGKKYQYVAAVLLLGILLLLWPTEQKESSPTEESIAENFDRLAIQAEMERLLGSIEGAGKLRLMLSVASGSTLELAENTSCSYDDKGEEQTREPLVISGGNGLEEVVITKNTFPKFVGAVVICEGGGNAAVRLNITHAISALTDLPSDKITVVKGKP